jgi:hypothetical protein
MQHFKYQYFGRSFGIFFSIAINTFRVTLYAHLSFSSWAKYNVTLINFSSSYFSGTVFCYLLVFVPLTLMLMVIKMLNLRKELDQIWTQFEWLVYLNYLPFFEFLTSTIHFYCRHFIKFIISFLKHLCFCLFKPHCA